MEKLREIVITEAAKKLLTLAFDSVTSFLQRSKSELTTPQVEIDKAITDHQSEVRRWASIISFSDAPNGFRLSDRFVPLDIYIGQKRAQLDDTNIPEIKLEDALATDTRSCVVLGQPGAGKTTAIKHICQRFFDGPNFLSTYQVLIRFQMRDLNLGAPTTSPEYIRRSLQELLRLRISYSPDLDGDENASARRNIRDQLLADWLNAAHALIILDGFDEITLKARRDLVIDELRRLARQFTTAAFILTTRSGEFNAHIENVKIVEIKPLSVQQIETFAERWLGIDNSKAFLSQLNLSPFSDTAIRPLTLAHLCVIFEKSRRIPSKPKTIYKKIVRLLIEDWDQERSVYRESAYANFEADRKEEFLANLSYELTKLFKTTTFTESGLLKGYTSIHDNFGLKLSEANRVVNELETHTGLILKSGNDRFEFSHKSIQEYLAAEFIVKMATIPANMIELQIMPNELAIATAISSHPSEYLTELVSNHFSRIRTSFEFSRSFVTRLLLENPDFEQTPRVGFALLALYSQYLKGLIHSSEQRTLFVFDRLSDEFAQLAQKIKQRVPLHELDEFFDKIETTHTFDGDPIWQLKRKKKAQARLRKADLSVLPSELWVRDSLLAVAPLDPTEQGSSNPHLQPLATPSVQEKCPPTP